MGKERRGLHLVPTSLAERVPEFSFRQYMILAWALVALGRGVLYTPLHPGYGDFPLPLTYIFSEKFVWVSGAIWIVISLLGFLVAFWDNIPDRLERAFWVGLLSGTAGWGGMYVSSIFLPHGTFGLFIAGELFLAVALAMWATKGPESTTTVRRQHRDRHTPGGH